MRTYKNIYKDYLDWMRKKTENPKYTYEGFLDLYGEQEAHALLYRLILELCYDKKDGIYYFVKFIIGDLMELGYPKPLRYNSLLRKWDKLLKRYDHIAILSARGHGKSVFFSELLNIYDMFLFPFRRVIVISAAQDQSNHLLDEIKSVIQNNEWLNSKRYGGAWANERIEYNKGYMLARGVGSEILGQHVDRIVMDDIIRTDMKLSDQEIEDYVDMNLEPMILERKGQIILVGTPKRETDIFNTIFRRIQLEPQTSWKVFRFPAILNYEEKTLQCPDRFTWEELMTKRLAMTSLKFAREYQLEFFSRELSLFPSQIIRPAKDKGKEKALLMHADNRGNNWTYVGGIDVARAGTASADFTVVYIIAFDTVTNAKEIIFMWRDKGLKIKTQAEKIAEISSKFRDPYFLVEENNFGKEMIERLADMNVNVEGFITGARGQKKDELIRFLITAFEYEHLVIPRADEVSRYQMDILEDELSKFCVTKTPAGNERFEGVGAHDDCVMALALANKATQIAGIPFAVTKWGEDGKSLNHLYDGFGMSPTNESELVNKILMGIIK